MTKTAVTLAPKLAILAKPNAKKSAILRRIESPGRATDAMTIEVAIAAPPTEGRANEELVRVLAKTLGVKKKDVTILSGDTGRNKLVSIEGLTIEELHARVGEVLARVDREGAS